MVRRYHLSRLRLKGGRRGRPLAHLKRTYVTRGPAGSRPTSTLGHARRRS